MTKPSEMPGMQEQARKYAVRRMDLHFWGDMCIDGTCEPVYTAEDYEALLVRLHKVYAHCDRVRKVSPVARSVLKIIGPLPPLPPQQKRTEK